MTQNNSSTENIPEVIILDFIRGLDLTSTASRIHLLSQRSEKNALDFFNQNLTDSLQKRILDQLTTSDQNYFKTQYDRWRTSLNIPNKLIHFLEFLSQKEFNFHRIRYLVKQIHQTKAPIKYHRIYFVLLAGIVIAGVYFARDQHAWVVFLNWLQNTLPQLCMQLVRLAMQTQNLSLLIMIYQTIKYLLDAYFVFRNHSTDQNHKIRKITKITLTNVCNIAAQTTIFLNIPYNYISGLLFLTAGCIDLLWSLVQLFHLEKTYKPDPNIEIEKEEFIRLLEAYYYYERKKIQSYIESVSLFFILTASFLSIFFSPNIACLTSLCAIFQFFVSLTKNHYYNHYEEKFANTLQKDIEDKFAPGLTSTPSKLSMFNNKMASPPLKTPQHGLFPT